MSPKLPAWFLFSNPTWVETQKKTLFQLSLWTAEIFVHVYEFREMHVTTGEDLKAAK